MPDKSTLIGLRIALRNEISQLKDRRIQIAEYQRKHENLKGSVQDGTFKEMINSYSRILKDIT